MLGTPVYGQANHSPIMLIGQAPGFKEIEVHKPFAWTAGKTLFSWFEQIGLSEEQFRQRIYMSAVCRCYPGKKSISNKQNDKKVASGDRVPDKQEIKNCSQWLQAEVKLLQPKLIIPVGKLAISQIIKIKKLNEVIGISKQVTYFGHQCDMLALPHPSGVSTWIHTEPGKTLLRKALERIKQHPSWKEAVLN